MTARELWQVGVEDGKSSLADEILTILSTNYIDKVKVYQIRQLCLRHYKEPDYKGEGQASRTQNDSQGKTSKQDS